jgi:hypothetical protein
MDQSGNTIVGTLTFPATEDRFFRWTPTAGTVSLGFGTASAVTPDGHFIVGTNSHFALSRAFKYSDDQGQVSLGVPAGFTLSGAAAVSSDGNVVAGYCQNGAIRRAFRWTSMGGFMVLNDVPGGANNFGATCMSADGSVISGEAYTTNRGTQAFIWDQVHGTRILADVLTQEFGLDLSGWGTLLDVNAMSPDGRFLVGDGQNPEGNAFVVVLPGPSLLTILGVAGPWVAMRRRRARRAGPGAGRAPSNITPRPASPRP